MLRAGTGPLSEPSSSRSHASHASLDRDELAVAGLRLRSDQEPDLERSCKALQSGHAGDVLAALNATDGRGTCEARDGRPSRNMTYTSAPTSRKNPADFSTDEQRILAALPGTVLAVTVSANCHTYGGTFITYGTADNWQDHTHGGYLRHTWYYGRQYVDEVWWWETGVEYGTVNGPNLAGAGAACPV